MNEAAIKFPAGTDAQHTLGTVMIVDDTPANLALLSDALEEQGYRVLVATDGYSALEQLRYIAPDVILLDGMMPGMDGFETCRKIKFDERTRNIPILFMTALGDMDNLLRGFNEGALDYIVKPFRNEEVLARVGAHVAHGRTIKRAELALAEAGLAALALDGHGRVTWITAAASALLSECTAEKIGQHNVPRALLDLALGSIRNELKRSELSDASSAAKFPFKQLLVKVSACLYDEAEYLLLLQKTAGDWNLTNLRSELGLTAREAEVLMWISRGKTNRDIGLILDNSPRTINKHLEHIFEKLGVATRSAAVSVALQYAKADS
ncbi:MAG TPA: response regulator transcription factor [Spongiibacteraceae bacterium]|nr:response regulator transcription factor [Spongiibacteraceae bacterium]